MRWQRGQASVTSPESTRECDTFTCAHCQRIVFVPVKQKPEDMGGLCRICDGLVCPQCVGKGCTPWEEAMRRIEARSAALNSYERCWK